MTTFSPRKMAIISGDLEFKAARPSLGMQAVVKPAPECKQASAQRSAAPIVSALPAMINAWPNVPLWLKAFRGLIIFNISSGSLNFQPLNCS